MKLFKYPCVKEKAGFNEFYGHSSHVTGVKFTANDTFVVSTGGNDKTVMVWDTDINDDDQAFFGGGAGAAAAGSFDDEEETKGEESDEVEGFEENRLDKAKE